MSTKRWIRLIAIAAALLASVCAQQPEAVDDELLERRITEACARLHEDGHLRRSADLLAEVRAAGTCEPTVPPRRTGVMETVALRDLLAQSVRIVAHYYECSDCGEWHVSASSGFCLAADGAVATCLHVLEPDEVMRESFVVVADLAGKVWPVEHVVAADAAADVCVLSTSARDQVALPLRPAVAAGERIWCLSNPDHQFGFFSEGLVARRYVQREEGEGEPERRTTWLHVTCDFARGSSGAPIVDAAGNVVALAQSTTTVVHDEDAVPPDTQMVFKTAAPAEAVLALLRPPEREAAGEQAAGRGH
jgi:S1-C subfamily serine protease